MVGKLTLQLFVEQLQAAAAGEGTEEQTGQSNSAEEEWIWEPHPGEI